MLVGTEQFHWSASIQGPSKTPYEGAMLLLDVLLPANYPLKPPVVYDCIIQTSQKGDIKLDILKEKWTPTLTILKVLQSIFNLLAAPNLEAVIKPALAMLFKTDNAKYL